VANNDDDKNMNIQEPPPPGEAGGGCLLFLVREKASWCSIVRKTKSYDVFVSDGGMLKTNYKQELIDNGIDFEEGGHTTEKILNADEIVKSPGIPEKNELVKKIRTKGIR